MKRCCRCREEKPLSAFGRARSQADGHARACKACEKLRYEAHADTKRAYQKSWRAANREQHRAHARAYAAKHPDRVAERHRRWRRAHPDRLLQRTRSWRARHPHAMKVYNHRRRARHKAAQGDFTQAQWIALCDAHGGCCAACGERTALTADHIVPLSRGGSNGIDNIQPLCRSCNSRKHTRTVDYRKGAV